MPYAIAVIIIALFLLITHTDAFGAYMSTDNIRQWEPLADKYAERNSVLDPEEILAIIWNESSGNPNAETPSDPSWGLMGVTMLVGKAYASVSDPIQLKDPEINVRAGSGFLAYLKARYQDDYPLLDENNGWVQMYNLGETKFLRGARVPEYQSRFLNHLNILKG